MTPDAILTLCMQFALAVATVATIKADMNWIKRALDDHEKRLRKVERHSRQPVSVPPHDYEED